jgi:hypothetical protein
MSQTPIKPANVGALLSVHLSDYMKQQPTGLIQQSAYDEQRIGGVYTVIMAEMVSMTEIKSHARTAVIKFILAACDASKEPCWLSVPGHHDKPLRTLMRLSNKDYAATLLAAGLVSVTKFNKVGC